MFRTEGRPIDSELTVPGPGRATASCACDGMQADQGHLPQPVGHAAAMIRMNHVEARLQRLLGDPRRGRFTDDQDEQEPLTWLFVLGLARPAEHHDARLILVEREAAVRVDHRLQVGPRGQLPPRGAPREPRTVEVPSLRLDGHLHRVERRVEAVTQSSVERVGNGHDQELGGHPVAVFGDELAQVTPPLRLLERRSSPELEVRRAVIQGNAIRRLLSGRGGGRRGRVAPGRRRPPGDRR